MTTIVIKCPCGKTHDTKCPKGQSLGIIAKASPGWGFAWNQSNGLESIWLCPECKLKAYSAIEVLEQVFTGIDLSVVMIRPLIRDRKLENLK
ncbi:hypothetical protein [Myxococcus phage Mx1]|nr:hypothetical protein [Myxococcus phage Mx1]